ncbi:Amylopullulanase / [hydrothermal vent metagenome]|uniref:Amylopullulanase n=1 Tax=hydrothermal vent metagenome TaxID=652676 RepID=A0A1W1BAV0_9ZZZZ
MKSSNPKIELSFLWHMHQPDYRDAKGIMRMPWVFLHAIKDYYDMPWMLSKFPQLKASFNLTPPLIEQLKLYENPLDNDYFLSLWYKEPNELNQNQRDWLIKSCKSANYEMMIKKSHRYLELYNKEKLTDSELIDLEILFILAWSGPYIRLHSSVVQELLTKSNFTSLDKIKLFDILIKFVSTILPFYSSLLKSKQISLSTTPYNHPILPLLLDMDNIQKANPNSIAPNNSISLYDDAKEQVSRAIKLYKDVFKEEPIGFWPAEGAVDEGTIDIYKEFGIKWIATDEAILFKSLDNHNRSNLYKPYIKDGLNIYFRDHGLSDLFGFDYRFKPPSQAVEHFIESLKSLQSENSNETNTVFVILDGENAWEYYQSNGYSFFMQLYEELVELNWCKTTTMDEIAFRDKSIPLDSLASGSWIYGDFVTWSGHPQKNRAWEMIFNTKKDYLKIEDTLSDEVKEKIKFHFLASECSDWFWWYGDDHNTSFAVEFDKLFRGHLITIYELMKKSVPVTILTPIINKENTTPIISSPKDLISPSINKKQNNFFEWINAGVIYENSFYSTMDRVRGPIEIIKYGFDKENIYILFEGNVDELEENTLLISSKFLEKDILSKIKITNNSSIEFSINRNLFNSSSDIELHFEIQRENEIIQSLPSYGVLEINLDIDYSQNWFV